MFCAALTETFDLAVYKILKLIWLTVLGQGVGEGGVPKNTNLRGKVDQNLALITQRWHVSEDFCHVGWQTGKNPC